MKDKKEKKRIESDMIIISILILLLIIGLITKPYKKKMKQEEVIQNISEHNWGKNGEDLLKCVHCKRTLKIGDLIEYKPDKTTNTVRIMDKETGILFLQRIRNIQKNNIKNSIRKKKHIGRCLELKIQTIMGQMRHY